jgi:diguanylate cyclase (GGDEF)-like protein/PAS domain S-box-containing protein
VQILDESSNSKEQQVRSQTEADLSALIESTDDLWGSVDLDFRLRVFNRAFQRYIQESFGILPQANMRAEDLMPPSRASFWPPLFRRALAEGSIHLERELVDGRTLELFLNPILVDGQATGIAVYGKDVTERKAVEKASREAEKKYRAIFDGALHGIFQTSLDSRVLSANPALVKMLGFQSFEEAKAALRDLAADVWADAEEHARFMRLLAERQSVSGYECRMKRKDGSVFWVSLHCRRVFDDEGRALYNEGFVEDITERRQSSWALAEREARLRRIFDQNGSIMLQVEPVSGEIVDANTAAAAFYGYPGGRLIGMNIAEINILPAEEVAQERLRALREERTYFKFPHRLASGEVRNVEVYSSPIHVGGRSVLFSIVHDVTDRQQAEKHLRDSEERYRATFEQAAVGIVHTAFDGRYLRSNKRFAEILGYALDEIPGLSIEQVTPEEDRAQSLDILKRMASGQSDTIHWEKRYRRKDGSPIWARLATSIQRDGDGNAIYQISFVEDIHEQKAAQERLAAATAAMLASEARYRTAFQTSLDGIAITRLADGGYIDANPTYLRIYGYEREEVLGHTTLELNHWVDTEDRRKVVETLLRDKVSRNVEARFRKKNGEIFWGLASASYIECDGVPCLLSVLRDVTEAKAVEARAAAAAEALRLSEERYRTAFHTSLDCIAISTLKEGRYVDVNPAFLSTFGFEREEVIGHTAEEIEAWVDLTDRQNLVEVLRKDSVCRNIEVRYRRKSGQTFWGMLSAALIEVDGVPCHLGVIRDISEAKAAQEEIRNLAFYDPLTHLPNRRLLLDRLSHALSAAGRTNHLGALLFVDLDDFKTINDTLGHRVGDLMLEEVAHRMILCVRKSDTVARLGGDEFVVLLEELSKNPEEAAAQARIVAEKIVFAVEQPFLLDGRECRSAACIGITLFGNDSESTDAVLQQADIAMYQAKTAGRSSLRFFAPALQLAVNARASLEEELLEGIRLRQFDLYFQPQIGGGVLIGAEALIRWRHPRRGVLGPGEFISLAEESGLILPLGNWVLETACEQLAAWALDKATERLTLAVNISARQFRQPDFVDRVLKALLHTKIDPRRLKLELTESMLVENVEEVAARMAHLKAHGVDFALDDFGTGYSSLSYLKRLPLHQLKIDRSFIRDILTDASSGAIAQTVISLGRAMGLSVLAEGVETEEQRAFLARLGCHIFQGFLVSRPLPLEEFQRQIPTFSATAPS